MVAGEFDQDRRQELSTFFWSGWLKRCYETGRAVARIIESSASKLWIAVAASGFTLTSALKPPEADIRRLARRPFT
jgi:hypothetical protein